MLLMYMNELPEIEYRVPPLFAARLPENLVLELWAHLRYDERDKLNSERK